ncbi:MAG: tetratricopeptide repeat protein, partial [Actinomycetota bacterium]
RYAYQRGAGDEALAIIEAAREIYKTLGEFVGAQHLAEVYEGIGHVLRRLNRNDEASESVATAVGLLREDYSWQLPNLLKLQAHWHAEDGKWEKAAEYFAEAARLDEIEDDFLLLAEDLINLGTAHFEMSEFEKALEVWLRSLPLYKEYGDFEGLCLCYQRIGEAYVKLGRGIDAIAFAQKALDIAESSGCTVKIVDALIVFGKARHATGEFDIALELLTRAREVNRSTGRPRWRQVIEGEEELALLHRSMGEVAKAEEIESRMRTIREIWDS